MAFTSDRRSSRPPCGPRGSSAAFLSPTLPHRPARRRYWLGDQPVDLTEDGRVVLAGTDRLAGSALNMARGVSNLMRIAGLSMGDEVSMANVKTAAAGGDE